MTYIKKVVTELTTKKIYVINGSGGVGKDTFVSFVSKQCNNKVANISSITPIKEIAKRIGWKGEKTEKDRKFLSDLKDLLTNYCDCSMNYIREQCIPFLGDKLYTGCNVMFIHIREPQEIQKVVKEFDAKTILITNKNVEQVKSNHADAEVFNYKYDIQISNDGSLEQLEDMAKSFCEFEKLI